MPRPAHPAATAARARTLRRQNHLQHFARVFKKFSELVALRPQRFRRQLRRHLDPRHRRIFRHVANLIHLDAGFPRQRALQLLRQRRRLGIPARKRAHKSRELRLRQSR
jgi:hypothetical protein